MTQTSNPLFPPTARSSRAKHVIIALLFLIPGAIWVVQTARRGAFTADPSGVTMVIHTTPAKGEREVLPNAFISAYLNPGHSIDRGTLDSRSVQLYRTTDRMPVA